MTDTNKLPKGWVTIKLGELPFSEKGKSPKKLSKEKSDEFNIPYINIKAFELNVIDEYTDGVGCVFCSNNDLVMVWDGSRSGLVGKAIQGALGSTLMKLSFFGINNEYAFHFLKSKFGELNSRAKGVGIPHVDPFLLWQYSFPIPPLAEQERIVSKIEELLSDLENGKQQLETVFSQLKIYKQALIKFAFEGKLTKDWRKRQTKLPDAKKLLESIQKERIKRAKENNEKLKKIKPLTKGQIALLPKLPKGWAWCRNEELLDYTTSGSRDWKKYYNNTGSLFIRTQDIKTNSLVLENVARVKLPKNVEGKRSLVEINDLLMTITGANVGKVARVDLEIREAYVSQSVALMKFIDNRISPYIFYYFQAREFGATFIEKMVYGVGRQVLSLENMRDVPVCICSIREQSKIIQELESRLSVCDKLEEIISQSIKQSESLKQSILQKAFEGKLVEQNPNDESAEILLARVKKERAEFLLEEKRRKKETPRTLKVNNMAEQLKTILQLLQKSKKPLSAQSVWKSSKYADDIDAFYEQLKEHIEKGEIKEIRKGKESLLTRETAK